MKSVWVCEGCVERGECVGRFRECEGCICGGMKGVCVENYSATPT